MYFSGSILSQEVIRVEKTMEISESSEDEDEPTLSLSTVELGAEEKNMDLLVYNQDQDEELNESNRRRSTSESSMIGIERSRSSKRLGGGRGFEVTQSVDRSTRERSPVFFLEPDDWIRTQGSSPFPCSSSKLLDSLSSNLDVFSESEENLNAELTNISSTWTKSDIKFQRSQSETPSSMLRDPGIRSRSSTPAGFYYPEQTRRGTEEERQRKIVIPILSYRNALMVG